MPRQNPWLAGTLPKRGDRRPAGQPTPSPAQQSRVRGSQRQNLIGEPLERAMTRRRRVSKSLGRSSPVQVSAFAAAAILAVIGIASGDPVPLVVAAALVGVGIGWSIFPRASGAGPSPAGPDLIDGARHLDSFLAEVGPRLPAEVLTRVGKLKGLLVQAAEVPEGRGSIWQGTQDDCLFLDACMHRYLPDACHHYLAALEASALSRSGNEHDFALESIQAQIDMLSARIQDILDRRVERRLEQMENHRKFISQKR